MKKWIEEAAQHPRPDRIREETILLDGEWGFEYDRLNVGRASGWENRKKWPRKITVPFCVESDLSGIGDKLPPAVVWYHRKFNTPNSIEEGKRLRLNFGAVDYRADVWVNGHYIGKHSGGYTPFSFDITDALNMDVNDIVVRVKDTLDPRIPRGKQSFLGKSFLIHYATVTGIWQSVYLETTGDSHIENFHITPFLESGDVMLKVNTEGVRGFYTLGVVITAPNGKKTKVESDLVIDVREKTTSSLHMSVSNPSPWTPAKPNLYTIEITLTGSDSVVRDSVRSYFGFRTLEIDDGVIKLNGSALYQKLLLNQGYFPGGHYTPENNDFFRKDIQQAIDMGFNGVRMHQKIESPHFLFWADALGFLVWEEMPSSFLWSKKMRDAIRTQWQEVYARDANHPCIIAWVMFCESWGVNNLVYSDHARDFVREMTNTAREEDPYRFVVDNSGFEHVDTDILDIHQYLGTVELCREFYDSLQDPQNMEFKITNIFKRFDPSTETVCPLAPTITYSGEPVIISEYGGFGFYKTEERPLFENFREYTLLIAEYEMFQGYCYTQQYDVEQEQNGLLDFDRNPKISIEEIRSVNNEVDKILNDRK